MKKLLPYLFFIAFSFFLLPHLYAQSDQNWSNGQTTTPVNFTGSCTYTWTNSNPSIGLPAKGMGAIPSFTAINTGSTAITATITATPIIPSNFAYIANSGSNTVSVINTTTNTITGNPIKVGTGPYGVAVSPDGNYVYVSNRVSSSVSVISTSSNTVVAAITVQSNPLGLCVSPDGKVLYVANDGASTISVINTATYQVMNTFSTATILGANDYGLAISPDGSELYITYHGSGIVSVVNTITDLLIANISVGFGVFGIVVSPDGKYVYVASELSTNISVIDVSTNKVILTIHVSSQFPPAEPACLAISADGSELYVSDEGDNFIYVINTATDQVTNSISVGAQPHGISLTPDGNELYVSNEGSNSVSVINTASGKVINTINVGSQPYSFGNFVKTGVGCAPISFNINVDPTPPPTITTTTPTGTISACVGTPSADPNVEQFDASGTNLTGDITVKAPTGFEVSRDIGGTYSSSLTLTQTLGSVGSSLVYVRSSATAPAGIIPPGINVTLSSAGATDKTVALSGTIYAIPSANTPGSQTKINGQPTDPVIFTGNATTYSWVNSNTSIGLASSGTEDVIPSFTAINNTGSAIIATITVTPVNGGDCNGTPDEFYITVDPTPPVLTVAGTLAPLTTVYGTASPAESFTVSCTTIASQILVTPPPGFEVSSDGTTFSSTVTITTKVSNSPVTIYIRLAASTHAGNNYGGNVTVSTANAANVTITMPISVVTTALLTITANNKTKPYGAVNPPLTVSYSGFVNNDGPAQLTALPVLTTIATGASAVGQYVINVNGAGSNDYTFAYNFGVLTVVPSLSLQDIPNTFTPNGDGRNDTWVINGLQYYPVATVNIFNRWGQKLYYSLGYPIPWDGTYHGKGLPSGTYYFIIDLKTGQPLIAGWVAIIR